MHLILLPGFDGSGKLFDRLIHELGAGYDVSVIEYGDWQHFLDYVEYVESKIPDDRDVLLLAESFSGPVALELLARDRRNYKAAVLSATFCKPPYPTLIRTLSAVAVHPPRVLAEFLVRRVLLNGVADSDLVDEVVNLVAAMNVGTIRSRLRALLSANVESRLALIGVPTLVLSAKCDRLVPAASTSHLARALNSATLTEISGPHLLLQSSFVRAAQEIRKYFDAHA